MTSHIHRTHRSGWLRAGVLGANDGVLSISSLLLGVAAAHMSSSEILVTGFAGLVAGALSMGAGEYVSVSSQADTERADLDIERSALQNDYDAEHIELRDIYIRRGLDHELAAQVSRKLMAHDALGAHARDDIGITEALTARPLQAATTSSVSFVLGGIVPLLAGILAPGEILIPIIAAVSLVFLAALGAFAAHAGGAPIFRGAARVLMWGALTMGATGAVGALFGAVT
ncbi:VIT family protein [Herminiimonas sp. CN]|uniref:VIT1/CCC1 transporter family protein n=1 Tax=Herminiimonas sp. CN TaxID=1349818 RepID=UPI0004742002|nr:VIT family protein [Herminiimonas sp. CN]